MLLPTYHNTLPPCILLPALLTLVPPRTPCRTLDRNAPPLTRVSHEKVHNMRWPRSMHMASLPALVNRSGKALEVAMDSSIGLPTPRVYAPISFSFSFVLFFFVFLSTPPSFRSYEGRVLGRSTEEKRMPHQRWGHQHHANPHPVTMQKARNLDKCSKTLGRG
jgi:hypothetical protein